MRITITIALILLPFTNCIWGQRNSFSDSLLQFEKRIYQADPTSKDLIVLEKVNFLIASDSIKGQLLNEVRRINYSALPDSLRRKALWNSTLVAYTNSDLVLAYHYWYKYDQLTKDTCIESKILGYLSSFENDKELNRSVYESLASQDTLFSEFDQELHKEIRVKGALFKKISAFVIPGSGLIINGNVGKGLLSMGLNTGTVFFVGYLISNNAWVNAALWGTNLIGKFYVGGFKLTSKEIEKKENAKKKKRTENSALILEQILAKYPLSLMD